MNHSYWLAPAALVAIPLTLGITLIPAALMYLVLVGLP